MATSKNENLRLVALHSLDYKYLLREIKGAFSAGRLIALPTETVYGLAAPVNDLELVKKIFSLKMRPLFDPLIVHVDSIGMAKTLTLNWSRDAEILAGKFWPGPLTLVMRRSDLVDDLITAGLDTVAVRCPDHPIALEIIRELKLPLVAPSANQFKKLSPTTIEQVRSIFSESDVFMIDGGDCLVGLESTIVGLLPDEKAYAILRPGVIPVSEISLALPTSRMISSIEFSQRGSTEKIPPAVIAPGQMAEHYQPSSPLVVLVKGADEATELEKFASLKRVFVKIPSEPTLAARQLYKSLWQAAGPGILLIMEIDPGWLTDEAWTPIIDRLSRAATLFIK